MFAELSGTCIVLGQQRPGKRQLCRQLNSLRAGGPDGGWPLGGAGDTGTLSQGRFKQAIFP